MKKPGTYPGSSRGRLAKAPSSRNDQYVLRLYVTGMTERSAVALANLQAICAQYLDGRYKLEVIDLYQHPQLAKDEQIIAAPTLVKELPLPMRRMIGDLSDEGRVLFGLDLRRRP